MKTAAILFLFVFGAMGFSANLFIRAIFLYDDWQNGDEINWTLQAFLTFAVPLAIVVALAESMWAIGWFS
jgi:hypothetical protein